MGRVVRHWRMAHPGNNLFNQLNCVYALKNYIVLIRRSLCICVAFLAACSKMDDTYDEFIKDGEIVYIAKVDSVNAYPGNNRLGLSMLLISDPRISKVKVYWDAGGQGDSTEKAIQRTADVDTVRFSFNKLAEGTYTFYIYTYDNAGPPLNKNRCHRNGIW